MNGARGHRERAAAASLFQPATFRAARFRTATLRRAATFRAALLRTALAVLLSCGGRARAMEREGIWSAHGGSDAAVRAVFPTGGGAATSAEGYALRREERWELRAGGSLLLLPGNGGPDWSERSAEALGAARWRGWSFGAGGRWRDRRAEDARGRILFAETEFSPGAELAVAFGAPEEERPGADGGEKKEAGRRKGRTGPVRPRGELAASALFPPDERPEWRLSLLAETGFWKSRLELLGSARLGVLVRVAETFDLRERIALELEAEGPPARLGLFLVGRLGRFGGLGIGTESGGARSSPPVEALWRLRP